MVDRFKFVVDEVFYPRDISPLVVGRVISGSIQPPSRLMAERLGQFVQVQAIDFHRPYPDGLCLVVEDGEVARRLEAGDALSSTEWVT